MLPPPLAPSPHVTYVYPPIPARRSYSAQTFKHVNSGEGGLLVTDDDDVAAHAILRSGSYMLYMQHGARPSQEVFDRHRCAPL